MSLAIDIAGIWLCSGVGLVTVSWLMGTVSVPSANANTASVPSSSTPGPTYCAECGTPNPAGATTCSNCGKMLNP